MKNPYEDYAVKAKEIPNVQQEYTDIWELVKRFYRVQNDDAYWECVFQEARAYYRKHSTPNAKGLVIHFLEELERRWKEQRYGTETGTGSERSTIEYEEVL